MTSKLLLRQVKRVFGKDPELSEDLMRLLEMINQSYEHYERDRRLIERAKNLSFTILLIPILLTNRWQYLWR